ncbi:PAS domain S-box protein [Pseudoduganella sp. R-43]|uniref:hybrid sensor histidine kinase/response regulator n=1 Tax=unclassified Pseudoduganella TaxID=2637179 RepID=UPI003CE9B70C
MTFHVKRLAAHQFEQFISEVADYAIYTISPEGEITSWNVGAEQSTQYAETEVLGKHFSLFCTAEDRITRLPEVALRVAAEQRFEGEGWCVRKDGTQFWANTVVDAVRDVTAKLIGFTVITRDITERVRAQEALYASEQQFRLLVQSVTDYAIYLLSPSGIVTSWNTGAARIKGYESEEIVGQHFSRFYTNEDKAAGLPEIALKTAEREGRFEREGWRVRRDGTRFWAHVVIDPVRDRMGQLIGFAKVTRDVTAKRYADDALARAKDALFQSQKVEALGKLTGGVSHDFNNLLNVIVNGLHLLKLESNRETQQRTIDTMERAAKRGAKLTQQLLAFARQQPIRQEHVNVNQVLTSFEPVLRRAIRSDISLDLSLAPHLPDILVDEAQLKAAVLNLVVNARDAIQGNGRIVISTELDDTPAKRPDTGTGIACDILLRVEDTGTGMSEEVAQRAIEPFYTTKPLGEGTGLGLSQVYGLAGQSGGTLTLASSLGRGTIVTLAIPIVASATANASTSCPIKVLVVDDQPEVLEMTVQLIESLGYLALSAHSGQAALDLLSHEPGISILFSDVVMPGMNGLELASSAIELAPMLKVILATGYMNSFLLEQRHGFGLDNFPLLQKPFSFEDVARQLKVLATT